MTAKSDELVNELVSACIAFGRQVEPDWQTRIEKAQRELREYVEGLEADSERFTVHSNIGRQDNKSPNDTQSSTIVYGKESK
jgi:hypothetical protein